MLPYRPAFLPAARVGVPAVPARLAEDPFDPNSIPKNAQLAQNIGVVVATGSATILTVLGMGKDKSPVENMFMGFLAAGLLTIGGITALYGLK
jgi:hypothetical protein